MYLITFDPRWHSPVRLCHVELELAMAFGRTVYVAEGFIDVRDGYLRYCLCNSDHIAPPEINAEFELQAIKREDIDFAAAARKMHQLLMRYKADNDPLITEYAWRHDGDWISGGAKKGENP